MNFKWKQHFVVSQHNNTAPKTRSEHGIVVCFLLWNDLIDKDKKKLETLFFQAVIGLKPTYFPTWEHCRKNSDGSFLLTPQQKMWWLTEFWADFLDQGLIWILTSCTFILFWVIFLRSQCRVPQGTKRSSGHCPPAWKMTYIFAKKFQNHWSFTHIMYFWTPFNFCFNKGTEKVSSGGRRWL